MSIILNPYYVLPGGGSSSDAWYLGYSIPFTSNEDGWGGVTLRQMISRKFFPSGSKVRLTLTGHTTKSATISGMAIQHASGSTLSFETTPIPVTFSGNASVVLNAGATLVSDEISINVDSSKNLLVSAYITGTSSLRYATVSENVGGYKSGNDYMTVSASGYSSNGTAFYLISGIEVYGNPAAATWDPNDKNALITLSSGNRAAASSALGTVSVRATRALFGKKYFEGSYTINNDNVGLGLVTSLSGSLNQYVGQQAAGAGHYLPSNTVYRSGTVVYNGTDLGTAGSPIKIGIAVDGLKMWVIVEGKATFEGGGDPATGTTPTYTLASAGIYYPACSPHSSAGTMTINCGQDPFTLWTPSGGFTGIK